MKTDKKNSINTTINKLNVGFVNTLVSLFFLFCFLINQMYFQCSQRRTSCPLLPCLAAQVSFKCVRYLLYHLSAHTVSTRITVTNWSGGKWKYSALCHRVYFECRIRVLTQSTHTETLRLRLQIGKKGLLRVNTTKIWPNK